MNLQPKDLGWVAGIIEGEGWIGNNSNGKASPVICVKMTDEDTIRRFCDITGARMAGPRVRQAKKPTWTARIYGALAASWLMMIYQFLGERRRQRAREVIEAWRASPYKSRRLVA